MSLERRFWLLEGVEEDLEGLLRLVGGARTVCKETRVCRQA